MGPKCHTDSGEFWITYINGMSDGAFTVERELGNGNFTGRYNSDEIAGRCTGARITFDRPASRPVFTYDGNFIAGGTRIHGTRSDARRKTDETWDGTKTTLVTEPKQLQRRSSETSTKKSRGTRGSKTATKKAASNKKR